MCVNKIEFFFFKKNIHDGPKILLDLKCPLSRMLLMLLLKQPLYCSFDRVKNTDKWCWPNRTFKYAVKELGLSESLNLFLAYFNSFLGNFNSLREDKFLITGNTEFKVVINETTHVYNYFIAKKMRAECKFLAEFFEDRYPRTSILLLENQAVSLVLNNTTAEASEKALENLSGEAFEEAHEKPSVAASENLSDEAFEEAHEKPSVAASENLSGEAFEEAPENLSGEAFEEAPEEAPENLTVEAFEHPTIMWGFEGFGVYLFTPNGYFYHLLSVGVYLIKDGRLLPMNTEHTLTADDTCLLWVYPDSPPYMKFFDRARACVEGTYIPGMDGNPPLTADEEVQAVQLMGYVF
jgi:hypothetical protein